MELRHGFQNFVRQLCGVREALVQPVGSDQRGAELLHTLRVLRPFRIIRLGLRGYLVHVLARQDGLIGLLVDVAVAAVLLADGFELVDDVLVIVFLELRHGFQNFVRQRFGFREALVQPVGSDQRGAELLHALRVLRPFRIILRGIDVHEVLQQNVADAAQLVVHASPRAVHRGHRQLLILAYRAQQLGIGGRGGEYLGVVRRYLHDDAAAQIPECLGRGGRGRGGRRRHGTGRAALKQRGLRRLIGGAARRDSGALLERGHSRLRLAAVNAVGVAGLIAQLNQARLQLAHALVAVAGHEGHVAAVLDRVLVKQLLLHGHGGDAGHREAVLLLVVAHAARHLRGVGVALGGAGQVVQLDQPVNKFGDAFAAVAALKFYVAEVLGGALREERLQGFLVSLTGFVQTLLLLEGGDCLLRA